MLSWMCLCWLANCGHITCTLLWKVCLWGNIWIVCDVIDLLTCDGSFSECRRLWKIITGAGFALLCNFPSHNVLLRLYFFIANQITLFPWHNWMALAGQLGQSGQHKKYSLLMQYHNVSVSVSLFIDNQDNCTCRSKICADSQAFAEEAFFINHTSFITDIFVLKPGSHLPYFLKYSLGLKLNPVSN